MMPTEDLLTVKNLSISFPDGSGGQKEVLKGIDFSLGKGETLGIVGESGSGKSLTSLAIIGLLPKQASVQTGEVIFDVGSEEVELLSLSEKSLRKYRGNRISMIFQEPMTSLNPVHTCGRQVAEVLKAHGIASGSAARKRVLELFERVELPSPDSVFRSYPHQLSGGQKQRVMIAMAVACEPDLIIADEPTTALDVTVQKKILALLKELCRESEAGLIFITHDLGVVSEIADRVMVMYRGQVVEEGEAGRLLNHPGETYTKALLACRPRLEGNPKRLPVVADYMKEKEVSVVATDAPRGKSDEVLLKVMGLGVQFPLRHRNKGAPAYLKAVDDVSFEVFRGETLGLVGESGCGKSTLGRTLVGLQKATLGEAVYRDRVIARAGLDFPKTMRKKVQIIFQDPYSSLNPGLTVSEALAEPLKVHNLVQNGRLRQERVDQMLEKVGLSADDGGKYPHQFSGGQRQRICIARTLMVEPEFIVCDESVSALDVSVQAMVLNLLNDLKEEFGLTYIFISHDLSVVKYMSDRIMVMRRGQVVEIGSSEEIYRSPESAYTKELISSIPVME
jgi:peptide/nickel transport system ATP-binding protein